MYINNNKGIDISGKFLCKKRWYSICSMHKEYNKNCTLCNKGNWYNEYRVKFENVMWKYFPSIWHLYKKYF